MTITKSDTSTGYSSYYNVPVRVYLNRPASAYSVPVTNLVPGLDGKASSGPGPTDAAGK